MRGPPNQANYWHTLIERVKEWPLVVASVRQAVLFASKCRESSNPMKISRDSIYERQGCNTPQSFAITSKNASEEGQDFQTPPHEDLAALESQSDWIGDSQLRDIAREIPGLIWTCDKKLNLLCSLGSEFSVLKVRKEHLRNVNLTTLFPETDSRRIHVSMHLRAVNGEYLSYEVAWEGRTYQVALRPLFDERKYAYGCVGIALDISERKWSEEQIIHLAVTDPLTGLANYRRFRADLERELRRASRTGRTFGLLMIDLDGLKQINDAHGHLAGSKALCRVACALETGCRSMDTIARFGGDEFAVILPETDLQSALIAARRVCDALSEDDELPRISASFGVAVYPKDGNSADSIIAAADRALYHQKHLRYQGGNTEIPSSNNKS